MRHVYAIFALVWIIPTDTGSKRSADPAQKALGVLLLAGTFGFANGQVQILQTRRYFHIGLVDEFGCPRSKGLSDQCGSQHGPLQGAVLGDLSVDPAQEAGVPIPGLGQRVLLSGAELQPQAGVLQQDSAHMIQGRTQDRGPWPPQGWCRSAQAARTHALT